MMELRIFLATVVRDFNIELETPGRLPRITMYWMLDHINFNVRIHKHQS
jgi:hypothetical protein